jgi:hypothetical protein
MLRLCTKNNKQIKRNSVKGAHYRMVPFNMYWGLEEYADGTLLKNALERALNPPTKLIKYTYKGPTINNMKKYRANMNLEIQKNIWMNKLLTGNYNLYDVPYYICIKMDIKFIESFCLKYPVNYDIKYIPLTKLTTNILLNYCMLYSAIISSDLNGYRQNFPKEICDSLGNMVMYITVNYKKFAICNYYMINAYNTYIDIIKLMLMDGYHRKYLFRLCYKTQNKIFDEMKNLPLEKSIRYTYRYSNLVKILNKKRKSVYIELSEIQKLFVSFIDKNNYMTKYEIMGTNIKLLLIKVKRPTQIDSVDLLFFDKSKNIFTITQTRSKKELQKIYIKVFIPDNHECTIIKQNVISTNYFEIHAIDDQIILYK